MKKIQIRVPATSANLGPGFDVLGIALKLYNRIEIERKPAGDKKILEISIRGEGKGFLPENEKNIVIKAMKAVLQMKGGKDWKKKYNINSFKIVMENNIPIGSGLGSSSAAYLCGILAANAVIKDKLSKDEIISLGIKFEGHSDNIIPALSGGFCAAVSGKGKTGFVKLKTPDFKAVVVTPDFQLPTEKARKVLPKKVPLKDAVFNLGRISLLIAAMVNNDAVSMAEAMEDKLHQPYRERLIPGMKKLFETALEAGAYGVSLSGSGPSIIAFSGKNKAKNVGLEIEREWKKLKIRSRYMILDFDNEGAKVWA